MCFPGKYEKLNRKKGKKKILTTVMLEWLEFYPIRDMYVRKISYVSLEVNCLIAISSINF